MKKMLLSTILTLSLITVAGCSSNDSEASGAADSTTKSKDTITMVWYPNESGADLQATRDEFSKLIGDATGKKVINQTTTDYIIAIEAIANGNADMSFMGPQGYVEAHAKNDKVLPLVVPSGESGTLDDALYYSWLSVKKGEEEAHKTGDKFAIDNIVGKKFSFVSNSSTSGFKVPVAGILGYFGTQDKYKSLTSDDLLQGGKDEFFSEVLYGGSHQGSAVNLLTGKADVAAFCDTCVANYVDLESGTDSKPGAVYKVKEGAAEPFNTLIGKEFSLISTTAVLNSPITINTETVSEEDQKKLETLFTSDAVTKNTKIFLPKDSKETGIFKQKSGNEKFLTVDDAWFNPIRELTQ